MTQDIIRMAREAGLYEDGKFFVLEHGELTRFAAIVAAAERDACLAKIQAEIDHAVMNETRLPPAFGQMTREFAVRVVHLQAALDAIRAGNKA